MISTACRIGTPAWTRPENVLDQRARQTFCTVSPIFSGMRSLKASHLGLPQSLFLNLRKPTIVPTVTGDQQPPVAGHGVRHADADPRDRRQLAAEVLEDALEDGDQEGDQRQQHHDGEATDQAGIDHRRTDLASQRVGRLELIGDARQALLEHSRRLTGAHHRDVELVEDLGVSLQRIRQRQAGLDVAARLGQYLSQLVVLGLVLEHVKAAKQGHARSDHGRELSRHDRDVARLDLPEALQQVRFGDGRLVLDDVERDQPAIA